METAATAADSDADAAEHSPAFNSEPVEAVMPKSKRSPSDFLKSVLGRPVRVKLNSGPEYRGVLACLDGYMNIAMEQTEEYVDGQLKAKYGDCFIRGNNGTFLHSLVYSVMSMTVK
jgi:U6 snRNA-associated Sm-like protein LSm6